MPREIILDENGEAVDFLKARNEEIKKELQEIVDKFSREANAKKMSFTKYGFRLLMQIEDKLTEYGIMSADQFTSLEYEDIEYYWRNFHSLFAYYNRYFEIVPNRQSFMLYMGINSRMYNQLRDNVDEDIRNLMIFIEDRLVGKGFSATESGNVDSRSAKLRMEAKDVGHNVVSASEDMALQAVVTGKTPQEIKREAMAILGNDFSLLTSKSNKGR